MPSNKQFVRSSDASSASSASKALSLPRSISSLKLPCEDTDCPHSRSRKLRIREAQFLPYGYTANLDSGFEPRASKSYILFFKSCKTTAFFSSGFTIIKENRKLFHFCLFSSRCQGTTASGQSRPTTCCIHKVLLEHSCTVISFLSRLLSHHDGRVEHLR